MFNDAIHRIDLTARLEFGSFMEIFRQQHDWLEQMFAIVSAVFKKSRDPFKVDDCNHKIPVNYKHFWETFLVIQFTSKKSCVKDYVVKMNYNYHSVKLIFIIFSNITFNGTKFTKWLQFVLHR